MASFDALFGDSLLGKDGNVATSAALSGKTGVLVYFSAHWCGPCRGFTPKLVEFYAQHAAAKGFEIVFVSSDHNQSEFDEYYGEMPWLALPYDRRSEKEALSKKYKVQGIPSLIVLGPDAKITTKDGREKVMKNLHTCDGFPWTPMTFAEAVGDKLIKRDSSFVGKEAITGKTLGLYFSAHWCPPCRGFTPQLKEFYADYKAKDPNFEIIFVSSDKSESEMLDYFKNDHGDYLALPYEKRREKDELSSMFGVEGIPTFVVVDANGSVVNANARSKIGGGVGKVLADGWAAAAVGDMEEGPEAGGTDINECPSVVVLCEGCDVGKHGIVQALEPLAKDYIAKGKAAGEDPEYIFFVASGESVDQLKEPTKAAAGEKMDAMAGKPIVLLFDIPDNGGFYLSPEIEVSTESIAAFIKSKESGSLVRLQLEC